PTLDGKNSWYNQTLEVFANRRLTAAEMRAKFELNRAVEAVGDATVSKDGSPLNMAAVDAAFAKMERHMDYLRVACNE
ncbi:hypothetical protein, partial [Salmonella sp. M292]|uniref:hypothetical protein n=1 Tax=Salmonella sp. M292 TaxID=3240308 RepID=UPI00352A1027